jgi:hypothetical protein
MQPFTVFIQLTPEDLVRTYLRIVFRRPLVILFTLMAIACLMIRGVDVLTPVDPLVVELIPWPFVLFPVVILIMNVIRANTTFKQSPRLRDGVEYQFSEDELRGKAVDSEWTYKWSAFVKSKETSRYLLLYPTKRSFEILPKEKFTEEQLNFIRVKASKHSI